MAPDAMSRTRAWTKALVRVPNVARAGITVVPRRLHDD